MKEVAIMKYPTYAEIIKPHTKVQEIFYEVVLVITGSIILAVSSKISFSLPFTPIPFTLQTFAVLFLSMLLGKTRSIAVITTYILEGVAGLPVFSKGSGVLYLLGPTGGYIFGFLVAGYVVGYLAEKGFDRKFWTTIVAMLFGNIIIFACGILWLACVLQSSIDHVLFLGVVPFIVGDVIKIFLAGILLPLGWKYVKKTNILS